ncbi:MAG: glycosyltransferase [Bacteroidales bacterium]|nr:glycosyltransferase [Bacteroidales bacterium]
MIWIASFPRSGNTFVRNILHDVYGLTSSEYHMEDDHPLEADYADHPFVKTHLLPTQLDPAAPGIKAVYIVRDGRDVMVSMAHQRQDIVAPGSDFYKNLKAAIIAEKDSFFGGWSKNVEAWTKRAGLIIRYEDLLADPVGQIERIREICRLPAPDPSKIPSFEALKEGKAAYGARKTWGYTDEESKKLADKAFRKGKTGGWKEEMPDELHDLFWIYHGPQMEKLGYTRDGSISLPDPELDHSFLQKLGLPVPPEPAQPFKVLLEANKMATPDNDGVKRYVAGLIDGLIPLTENVNSKWQFDLLINKEIISLKKYASLKEDGFDRAQLEKQYGLTTRKHKRGFFGRLESVIRYILPDRWIKWLTDNNIHLFHKVYYNIKIATLFLFFLLRSAILFLPRIIYTAYLHNKQDKEGYSIPGINSRYDLIHVPLQQHYRPFTRTRAPIVFTIHDYTHKLFPDYHTKINIKNAENGLRFIEKQQAHIINVSESTLSDSKKFLSLPDKNQHLIYEHVDEDKFIHRIDKEECTEVLKKYGVRLDMPYLLILGTIEPRKNVNNSIKAFQLLHKKHKDLNLSLVISGKQGWKAKSFSAYSNLITFTGFVDDEDLPALYSQALALSYVSFYEGFGLPILEAMRCETPIVYGMNSSMPEVVGKGGLGADPSDIEDICDKYEHMYFNDQLRKQLSIEARKQSLKFSTRKSVLELLGVYEGIIEQSKKQ